MSIRNAAYFKLQHPPGPPLGQLRSLEGDLVLSWLQASLLILQRPPPSICSDLETWLGPVPLRHVAPPVCSLSAQTDPGPN